MNFCFFTSANSLQGGAELSQVRIVAHLLGQGHRVHVVLPFESDLTRHYRDLGAQVHVIYWQHLQTLRRPGHVLRYLVYLPVITLKLAQLLRRERIDLLHVNEILDFQGLVAARLARVPSLLYVRYIADCPLLRGILAALVMPLADRVVCVSQAVHRLALNGRADPKIRVIYNAGPDPAVFDPDSVGPIRPPGAEGKLLIGTVNKLVRQKGHLLLVELARRLDQRGLNDIHYVIVGGPVPGHESYQRELVRAIERAGLGGRFHLVGSQRNVASWMAGFDIACHFPLCEDCMPAVPMEAAVMRKPLLSFVSGGIPEQLTHPTSARLVPIGDIDALADNAEQLARDAQLRRQMGQAARQEVRAKFSMARHFSQLDGVYRELSPASGRGGHGHRG